MAARVPGDLVPLVDATGQRSAVIVAALREYLRKRPAAKSSRINGKLSKARRA